MYESLMFLFVTRFLSSEKFVKWSRLQDKTFNQTIIGNTDLQTLLQGKWNQLIEKEINLGTRNALGS